MRLKSVLILLFFHLLCSECVFAQNSGNSNKQSITSLTDSANKYIRLNPAKAIEYADKLLDASTAANNADGEVNAYKIIGSIYYNYGKYEINFKN